MPYLLDTNICIALIKKKPPSLIARIAGSDPGDLLISAISVAELRFGAEKSAFKNKAHSALDLFLQGLEVTYFDEEAAAAYGIIRARLERLGTPIGPLDTLLAAQAAAHELTLVTDNEGEFRRVIEIKHLENWIR